ncbi:hypothetical protein CF319_g2191 [Tilletia indica]|nr:hypothetical protein CF319_g2191 [Tilletia indica]
MWGSRMRSSSSIISRTNTGGAGSKKLHQDRNRKRRSGKTTSPAQPHREAEESSNGDRQVLPQPRHSRRRKRRRNEHPVGGATLAAAAAIAVATSSVAADSLRRFLDRLRKSKRKRDLNMAAQRVAADVPESVQVYTGKDRLSSLPVEVLFNIMDCMTAPALVYSLGPVSSRMAHVVDLYMRQTISKRINKISLPLHSSLPDEVNSGPESAFTLSFEARRPIDTTALTHELQFQGFEICEDAYKPSSSIAITYAKVWNPSEQVKRAAHHLMKTTAVFTFTSERGTLDASGRQEQRRREDVGDGPTPTPAPGWQAWKQPFVPTVPNRLAHRLGPRESSSSITIERQQVEEEEEEEGDQGEEEYEDEEERLELRHAVDAYDWAPTSTIGSHGHPSSKSSGKVKASDPNSTATLPNYRCHLDPLDSFETFLLSLSIKAVGRARNVGGFERRVASGCDRVMRNWFAPPPTPNISAGTQPGSSSLLPSKSNLPDTKSISSDEEDRLKKEADRRLGAFQVLASTFGAVEDCLPRSVVAQVRARATPPPVRTLEIDGSTCSIEIQPHANVDSILCSHPILRATSGFASISTTLEQSGSTSPASPSTSNSGATSSAWLFTSPFAYHSSTYATATTTAAASTSGTSSSPQNAMNLGSRVELRFHCTKVRIRAARLLAMLHRLEDEMLNGERQEKRFLLRTSMPSPTLGG